MKKIIPFIPLLLILVAIAVFYFSPLKNKLNFDTLQTYHGIWKDYAHLHPFLSALIFFGTFTVSVCLIIPDSILLGILAGFLFPLPLAVLYTCLSETCGAYLFYEAMRFAVVPYIHPKEKSFFKRLEARVQKNQVSFLLFFRFTHLLPFWIINTAAACLEIRRWPFVWTTFLGVIPLSFVLAQAGSGLGTFFENNTHFSVSAILNNKVKLALLIFGILAFIPMLWKLFRKR